MVVPECIIGEQNTKVTMVRGVVDVMVIDDVGVGRKGTVGGKDSQ